jgi:assimilatory nitrate reductase catalytic subunit
MHWGSEYLGGTAPDGSPLTGVNGLTTSASCPTSKQPELKHAAVRIEKVDLPWTLYAMAWLPTEQAFAAQRALRALYGQFAYATCVPFAQTGAQSPAHTGLWFQAAADQKPAALADCLALLSQHLGLNHALTSRYTDEPRGQHRLLRAQDTPGGAQIQAFLLAGDTQSKSWLSTLLRDTLPPPVSGLALLQARNTPPGGTPVGTGRTICTCVGVSAAAIQNHLDTQVDPSSNESACLKSLQDHLKCGTQCGSCVPELKKTVRLHISKFPEVM